MERTSEVAASLNAKFSVKKEAIDVFTEDFSSGHSPEDTLKVKTNFVVQHYFKCVRCR
jgi:hypothetical protein